MENVKKYQKENLTILWRPEMCKHSGVCVRALPKVYNAKAKPWMVVENASTEELKNQIKSCPSESNMRPEAWNCEMVFDFLVYFCRPTFLNALNQRRPSDRCGWLFKSGLEPWGSDENLSSGDMVFEFRGEG